MQPSENQSVAALTAGKNEGEIEAKIYLIIRQSGWAHAKLQTSEARSLRCASNAHLVPVCEGLFSLDPDLDSNRLSQPDAA